MESPLFHKIFSPLAPCHKTSMLLVEKKKKKLSQLLLVCNFALPGFVENLRVSIAQKIFKL